MNTPPLPLDEKTIIARERLRLLSLGYKISGCIGALMVSVLIFHFIFLTTFSFLPSSAFPANPSATSHHGHSDDSAPSATKPSLPDPFPFWFFRIFAAIIGFIILLGWTLGALTFYAGVCLARRRHKTFVQVMAGVNCLFIPYGILLGICTFVVLNSREAAEEFLPAGSP